MGNLGEILKGSVARLGITRQVEAVDIVEKATAEIVKIIPREDFEVISYKDGVLKVYFSSPAAANELMAQKNKIKETLGIKQIRSVPNNNSNQD